MDKQRKRFEFKNIIDRLNILCQDPDIISEGFIDIADNAKRIILESSFLRANDTGYIAKKCEYILNDC